MLRAELLGEMIGGKVYCLIFYSVNWRFFDGNVLYGCYYFMLDYMNISWQFIVCFQCSQHGMYTHGFMEKAVIYVVTSIMPHHTGLCLPLSEHVETEKFGYCLPQQHNMGIKCLSSSSIPQTLIEMRR